MITKSRINAVAGNVESYTRVTESVIQMTTRRRLFEKSRGHLENVFSQSDVTERRFFSFN